MYKRSESTVRQAKCRLEMNRLMRAYQIITASPCVKEKKLRGINFMAVASVVVAGRLAAEASIPIWHRVIMEGNFAPVMTT